MPPLRVVAVAHLYNRADSKNRYAVPCIISAPPPARRHNLFTLTGMQPDENGFLLSDGTFATRAHAYQIAAAAKQILPRRSKGFYAPNLYSEDLW